MYFNYLEKADPEVTAAIKREINRQETKIEMIASENFVNYEIMEAAGSALTNKYAEGYPGKRYYGGCEFVDEVEALAIDRALSTQMYRRILEPMQIQQCIRRCWIMATLCWGWTFPTEDILHMAPR